MRGGFPLPDTYTSIQGDTWDMIAYKVYGEESAMAQLIRANDDIANIAIFPSGVRVVCPPRAPEVLHTLPPWRR